MRKVNRVTLPKYALGKTQYDLELLRYRASQGDVGAINELASIGEGQPQYNPYGGVTQHQTTQQSAGDTQTMPQYNPYNVEEKYTIRDNRINSFSLPSDPYATQGVWWDRKTLKDRLVPPIASPDMTESVYTRYEDIMLPSDEKRLKPPSFYRETTPQTIQPQQPQEKQGDFWGFLETGAYQQPMSIQDNAILLGRSIGIDPNKYRNPDVAKDARQAKTFGTIGSAGGLGLGILKGVAQGRAEQKTMERIYSDMYDQAAYARMRANRVMGSGEGSPLKTAEQGGQYPNLPTKEGGKKQDGKQDVPLTKEQLLTQRYATAVPRDQANAEIENKEVVMSQDGDVQQAVGKTHDKGGIPVQLEDGDIILSDKKEIGVQFMRKLNKEYDLKLKPSSTYAQASAEFAKKVGINKLLKQQEEYIAQIDKTDTGDKATDDVNKQFLSEKLRELEAKKEPLLQEERAFVIKLYEKQTGKKYEQPQQQQQGNPDELISAYAQASGVAPEDIVAQLQQMQPEEAQQALMQMEQELTQQAPDQEMQQQGVESQEQDEQQLNEEGNPEFAYGGVFHTDEFANFAKQYGMTPEEAMMVIQNNGQPLPKFDKGGEFVEGNYKRIMAERKVDEATARQLAMEEYKNNFSSSENPFVKSKLRSDMIYNLPGIDKKKEVFNITPSYGYGDLKGERARYEYLLKKNSLEVPKDLSEADQKRIDEIAGTVQRAITKERPLTAMHYGTTEIATRKSLQYAVSQGLPKDLLPKGVLDKKGNVKIGLRGLGLKEDELNKYNKNIYNWIDKNLDLEKKATYAGLVFVDDEGFYRSPEVEDQYFTDLNELNKYTKDNEANKTDANTYFSGKNGLYIRPFALQEKWFNTAQERDAWIEKNKANADKLHPEFLAEDPNSNIKYIGRVKGEDTPQQPTQPQQYGIKNNEPLPITNVPYYWQKPAYPTSPDAEAMFEDRAYLESAMKVDTIPLENKMTQQQMALQAQLQGSPDTFSTAAQIASQANANDLLAKTYVETTAQNQQAEMRAEAMNNAAYNTMEHNDIAYAKSYIDNSLADKAKYEDQLRRIVAAQEAQREDYFTKNERWKEYQQTLGNVRIINGRIIARQDAYNDPTGSTTNVPIGSTANVEPGKSKKEMTYEDFLKLPEEVKKQALVANAMLNAGKK